MRRRRGWGGGGGRNEKDGSEGADSKGRTRTLASMGILSCAECC